MVIAKNEKFKKCDCSERKNVSKNSEKIPLVNSCIDYLKIVFLGTFDTKNESIIKLFDALLLDINVFDVGYFNLNTFDKCNIYDEHTLVNYVPKEHAKRQHDEFDYWILEMSGQCCRNFEQRCINNGINWFDGWKMLLNYIEKSMVFEAKRIDIALDDFNEIVPFDKLQEKLMKRSFTSRFRSSKLTGNIFDLDYKVKFNNYVDEFDSIDILDTRKGWSCTFGRGNTIEFQIYNKAAERKAKGYAVDCKSWMRYEMRFSDEKARIVWNGLLKSFNDDSFYKFCGRLIYSLIQFKSCKEKTKLEDRAHMNRLRNWICWSKFCGCVEKINLSTPSQNDIEHLVTKREKRISKSVSPTLAMLYILFGKVGFNKKLEEEALDAFKNGKITNSVIASINYWRINNGFTTKLTSNDIADIFKETQIKTLGIE